MEKPAVSDQSIIDCLQNAYGIKVATLTFLALGADFNARVYKAVAIDQSTYFVKLKHGHHHDINTIILSLLHDVGIQQIILPVKTKNGQSTQHIDDFTLIVSPFLEGQDGFSRDLTRDQWITLGKVMRQIHRLDVPLSVQAIMRRENFSPKWRDAVKALYSHIESERSGDDIALKLLKFMKMHATTIHRLIDRAEQLCEKIKDQLPEFVLCHADIHGGNVLMDENEIIYMVDWDDPIMAPKERDLMFIGGGVANVWNKQHEEAYFYKGYGPTEIDRTILAYYRHERIVEDIAEFGQQLLLTSGGGQDRALAYKHFVAQFEPRGVVEIAFRTDESLI